MTGKKRMRSASPTLGSKTAKDGYKVERILEHRIIQNKVIEHLRLHLPQDAKPFPIYPHGKKTDVFLAPWNVKFQIKKVSNVGKDRGHHVDRRSVERFTSTFPSHVKDAFSKFMISRDMTRQEKETLRQSLQQETKVWLDLLIELIIGQDPHFAPDYFLIVETKDLAKGKLYLLCVHTLLGYLMKNLHVQIKETCIHVTPCMYLQRRGGDATDSRPNDIQTKLVLHEDVIKLSSYLGEYQI